MRPKGVSAWGAGFSFGGAGARGALWGDMVDSNVPNIMEAGFSSWGGKKLALGHSVL